MRPDARFSKRVSEEGMTRRGTGGWSTAGAADELMAMRGGNQSPLSVGFKRPQIRRKVTLFYRINQIPYEKVRQTRRYLSPAALRSGLYADCRRWPSRVIPRPGTGATGRRHGLCAGCASTFGTRLYIGRRLRFPLARLRLRCPRCCLCVR